MSGAAARLPDWLRPLADGLTSITGEDLSRFTPPDDADLRRSAVLMLFGEGERGPDVLLTERAHDMRSHPGQVSFPGGGIEPGETPEDAALREACEEVGLDAAGVEVIGTLPELWLPPSGFAVVPVLAWWREPTPVRVASPAEVHAVYRVPLAELGEPAHRVVVRHPAGFRGPGFLIGDDHDVIVWGFTGGLIDRLFTYVGWSTPVDGLPERDLPDHMLAEYRARTAGPGDPGDPGDPAPDVRAQDHA